MRVVIACLAGLWLAAAPAQSYLIGPGDLLEVRVYEQEDLDTTARVGADGDIRLPLIGTVAVAGMSEREAEAEIARRLESGGFLRTTHVTVVIAEHVSNMVSVLGEVTTPGRYSLDNGNTLADVIAQANGTTENANHRVIVVSGDQRAEIDLDSALRVGGVDGPWRLRAGDVVYVPRMDMFYVYGEARQPGAYRLETNMTVMQALALGGSLTELGSERRVMIRRVDEDGDVVSMDADLTDQLQPNDVLYVRERVF
ncbi:MAG: polysaccharide biosynthesis/export family protein [Gammaproteobacteria bacterium]|nr:polysaccharide biosynthesis/export family protein [Gammaproteobacteria bacterium]